MNSFQIRTLQGLTRQTIKKNVTLNSINNVEINLLLYFYNKKRIKNIVKIIYF